MNAEWGLQSRRGRYARSRGLVLVTVLALAGVGLGCQENIQAGPAKVDYTAERLRLAQEVADREVTSASAAGPDEAALGAPGHAAVYAYHPEGRRDPFRSMLFELEDAEDDRPRAPLEQFELGQISLTGVVWSADQPRALVSDPEGRSFVVRTGSRVGKNEGRVVRIADNMVLVQETYVNFAGDKTTKNVELRMRRSQGG